MFWRLKAALNTISREGRACSHREDMYDHAILKAGSSGLLRRCDVPKGSFQFLIAALDAAVTKRQLSGKSIQSFRPHREKFTKSGRSTCMDLSILMKVSGYLPSLYRPCPHSSV